MTFRLLEGADEAAFLAADKRVQSAFAYRQPGMMRRTTARGHDDLLGEWIVIDLWQSARDADACAARWDEDPIAQDFMSFIEPTTVQVRRYTDFD
jgi:hypothetical protein